MTKGEGGGRRSARILRGKGELGLGLRLFPNPTKCVHRETPSGWELFCVRGRKGGRGTFAKKGEKGVNEGIEGIGGRKHRRGEIPATHYAPGLDSPPITSPGIKLCSKEINERMNEWVSREDPIPHMTWVR